MSPSHNLVITFPIFPTYQFCCDKAINLAFLGMQARASVVGVGRLSHHAIIHHHMAFQTSDKTRHSVCGCLPLPKPSYTHTHTKLGLVPLYLCFSCARTGSHQKVPMVAHSTPIKVPHLQQIHKQALAENGTHPQQSAHILQSNRSHILNPSHSARVSRHYLCMTSWSSPSFEQANSVAVRQNKIGICEVSNGSFNDGSSTI